LNATLAGHVLAVFTVFVWGITFVSSKVLLEDYAPVQILYVRILLAFAALSLCLKSLKVVTGKAALYAALAAFFGVSLYFVLENTALVSSPAANVSLIVSAAPLFVAITDRIFGGGRRLGPRFFSGFVVAMAGVALLTLHGLSASGSLQGDLLALGGAASWGFYNLFARKLSERGVSPLRATQAVFFFALLLTAPLLFLEGRSFDFNGLLAPQNLWNFLFLGLIASSMCFFTWNKALTLIGSVSTNVWLYGQAAVTAVAGVIFIGEEITCCTLAGLVLVTAGLMISENFSVARLVRSRRGRHG
jgi:drug/metabolite transporter (DMT)-like permease